VGNSRFKEQIEKVINKKPGYAQEKDHLKMVLCDANDCQLSPTHLISNGAANKID